MALNFLASLQSQFQQVYAEKGIIIIKYFFEAEFLYIAFEIMELTL